MPKHVDILRFFAQPKEARGSHQVPRDQIARRVRFLVGNLSPTLRVSPDDLVRRETTHLTPSGVCLRVFPQSDQITAGASSLPPSPPPSPALSCPLPFSIPSPETFYSPRPPSRLSSVYLDSLRSTLSPSRPLHPSHSPSFDPPPLAIVSLPPICPPSSLTTRTLRSCPFTTTARGCRTINSRTRLRRRGFRSRQIRRPSC